MKKYYARDTKDQVLKTEEGGTLLFVLMLSFIFRCDEEALCQGHQGPSAKDGG